MSGRDEHRFWGDDPSGYCGCSGCNTPDDGVTSVEPGCTCGGMAACQQCQERDASPTRSELIEALSWHEDMDRGRWGVEYATAAMEAHEDRVRAEAQLAHEVEATPSPDGTMYVCRVCGYWGLSMPPLPCTGARGAR